MDKIQEQLEKLDRLHKTKREYMWGLICQCLLLALLISSYVISIITADIVCLAIVSVFMGIVLFCVLNTITMLVAVRKRIIEETDKTCERLQEECERLHEENKKMFMSVFEQIDKEFQERKAMAQKKAEENKVEAEKKPIKKVNTTSSVKKKADPKKVSKKEN